MWQSSNSISFLSCLHFAIVNSSYCNNVLRPKQVISLENLYLGKDVLAVLPTGYGKSLIFHLLPALLFCKKIKETESYLECDCSIPSIVIVISPLNSLMNDQIHRLTDRNIGLLSASVLNVKYGAFEDGAENVICDVNNQLCEKTELENGHYNIVFSHPESLVSCKYGRDLMLSKPYQDNVCAVVVDEAHCILEW